MTLGNRAFPRGPAAGWAALGTGAGYPAAARSISKCFNSHSSKSSFASKVRDGVYAALTQKRFEVLLDKERLEPGDRWRAKLHRWLATCDAAVNPPCQSTWRTRSVTGKNS